MNTDHDKFAPRHGDTTAELVSLDKKYAALHLEHMKLKAQFNDLKGFHEQAVRDYEAIAGSRTWRSLAPIRGGVNSLRRLKAALLSGVGVVRRKGFVGALVAARRIASSEGLTGLSHRLGIGTADAPAGISDEDYTRWIAQYDAASTARRDAIELEIGGMTNLPLISIIMPTYNPNLRYLEEAIRSVQQQVYQKWELCIADDLSTDQGVREVLERHAASDKRIKVLFREVNGHICAASNSALELAAGEFVALLDHDDVLPDHALYHVADAINRYPNGKIFFSDEDKMQEDGRRCQPYFKSDWNYDLFLSHNMISHLGVYDRDLISSIGGFRIGLHGSQDWDLALRASEKLNAGQIVHIPHILYHWRIHPQSTSSNGQAAKPYAYKAAETALNDHFDRRKISARAEFIPLLGSFRAVYSLPHALPKVSLIIPTKNGAKHLARCVESILDLTTYTQFEILIVDNGSDDKASLAYLEDIGTHPYIRVLRDPGLFNYSRINNAAAAQATGTILALLNDDVEVINGDWLSNMVSIALQKGVGAVGSKLYYGDNTVQHAGIVLGVNGVADHVHHRIPRHYPGYFSKAMLIQSFSAVTAACMVVQKEIFDQVGGLDEVNLAVAFNDVDFCLRLREAGYRNVWTPDAELYHHESLTRGPENTPEKQLRFQAEIRYMQHRWSDVIQGDFAYNPNLDSKRANYALSWPPRSPTLPVRHNA